MPNVFNTIKTNTDNIQEKGELNNFINGESWKSKLENFYNNDNVIPYYLHIDGTQINNALGTHKQKGEQTLVHYTFPTIPFEYASRLDNIFNAGLVESSLKKIMVIKNVCINL